jgi:MoaA/NifB/PqqE/SkfB family radical SAM enzyme
MIFEEKINHIELEITSKCNAACLLCSRTLHSDKLIEESITLDSIKRIFPNKDFINNKFFNISGGLGDPVLNPECLEIVEYFIDNGARIRISTNAGYGPVEFWHSLGIISEKSRKLNVSFAIDGHKETNHIYREKTKFSVIERNLNAYTNNGSRKVKGIWTFIPFKHNEHEVEKAKAHAEGLGLSFQLKLSIRNFTTKTLNGIKNQVILEPSTIYSHSKKTEIENLYQTDVKNLYKTINCRFIHDDEVYISADQKVWPCCHIWGEYFSGSKKNIIDLDATYGMFFNSLKKYTLNEILEHKWFKEELYQSFNPEHSLHNKKCIAFCSNKYITKQELLKI